MDLSAIRRGLLVILVGSLSIMVYGLQSRYGQLQQELQEAETQIGKLQGRVNDLGHESDEAQDRLDFHAAIIHAETQALCVTANRVQELRHQPLIDCTQGDKSNDQR